MTIAETVSDWLADTPMGRKLIAEKDAKALAERQGHVAEIERIRAEQAEARPPLAKAIAASVRERAKAQAALAKTEAAEVAARGAIHNAAHRTGHAIHMHEIALRQTADPAIDDFIREMRDLGQEARKMRATTREGIAGYSPMSNRPVMRTTHSSYPSILARMEAVRAAIESAESLKVVAVSDVPAAIEEIRQSIPDGLELVPLED